MSNKGIEYFGETGVFVYMSRRRAVFLGSMVAPTRIARAAAKLIVSGCIMALNIGLTEENKAQPLL